MSPGFSRREREEEEEEEKQINQIHREGGDET